MKKYYTRACNFFYGSTSRNNFKKKKSLLLNGDPNISFDTIEIFSRNSKKKIKLKNIKKIDFKKRKKIYFDISNITKKKKFKNLNFSNSPLLMGILNLTPDSFSDGGKFNKKNFGYEHAKKLIRDGCSILDIGGESTRPGSKNINIYKEWKRISPTLFKLKKFNIFTSLDTRKSFVMLNGIKNNINLINDVSGLSYDVNTINILRETKIPFVIHHMQGNPSTMQNDPKYENVLLDIYDFFEKKIEFLRSQGIKHNNIILDPGIGFGKNLKHNIRLIKDISIFHSLGFPIMLGVSRKNFIKELSGENDSMSRIGGTISSSLYAIMQGVQILRVHDVNEVNQSIKVFKSLKF